MFEKYSPTFEDSISGTGLESGDNKATCHSCGHLIPADSRFCESCGVNLSIEEEPKRSLQDIVKDKIELTKKVEKLMQAFFSSPDGSHLGDMRVDFDQDIFDAKVRVMVRSSENDLIKFPEDFTIGFEAKTRVTEVAGRKGFYLKCELAEFTFGDKKLRLSDFCPKDVDLYIGGDKHCYNYTTGPEGVSDRKIFLESFYCPGDFIALLHEVGHVLHDAELDIEDIRRKDSLKLADRERSAWARAIRIARINDLGIEKNIKFLAQHYLDTYQEAEDHDGHTQPAGFTNKEKKNVRTKRDYFLNNTCPACGYNLELGSIFCSNCGRDLATE